jgi:RluA family pseudouridine synthase
VNGVRAGPETVLAVTDLIATYRAEVTEPPVNDHIEILYEDDGLMILNKPAPLPVHPSGRFEKNSLISILRERAGDPEKPFHPIYRLDAWTTGVFLMATESERARFLHRQVEKKRMKKTYAVLAVGNFGDAPFTVDAPIGRRSGGRRGVGAELEKSKPCVTRFTPLARARTEGGARPSDRPLTLLKAEPLTGRTNQIRIHIQHAGGYVLNDPLYSPMFTPEAWEEIPFLGLHCREMGFALTPGHTDFHIRAPWPEGFRAHFQGQEMDAFFATT